MAIATLVPNEEARQREFPATCRHIFMAHAAVTALPRVAVEAMAEYARQGSEDSQENNWTIRQFTEAREAAAQLIGAHPDEVALLGPTSLGLNMVAAGLPWQAGDEVIYHPDDYPANVYPWMGLESRGVVPVPLRTLYPGQITWRHVEAAITPRTRLVALASCSFLTGYRIDLDTIGRNLRERDILFSVDGIQSVGAFPLSVEHVDFLSADSHKWMLGPSGAGIFYVKRSRMETLLPLLLGAWNVVSPEYVAQEEIQFHTGARRYEAGTLSAPGIAGMAAAIRLLLEAGIEEVAARILQLRRGFLERIRPLGYRLYLEDLDTSSDATDAQRSGIITVTHPDRDMKELAARLRADGVRLSLRHDRAGQAFLRFSPHFYNNEDELDRLAALMR